MSTIVSSVSQISQNQGLIDSIVDSVSISPYGQRIIIITTIATLQILSIAGLISSGFFIASAMAIGAFVQKQIIMNLLYPLPDSDSPLQNPDSPYFRALKKMTPFQIAVVAPFKEELLFRGVLQQGYQWSFEKILTGFRVSWLPFSLAVTGAILVSGIIFGAAHYLNQDEYSRFQALVTTISGLALGVLFHLYGFFPCVLYHSLNNFIAEISVLQSLDTQKFT